MILGLEQETGFSFYIIIISIAATHVIDPFVGFQLAGPGQCLVLYPCHRSRQLVIMKIFCEGNQPVNDDGGFAVPTWCRIRGSRAANCGLCRCTLCLGLCILSGARHRHLILRSFTPYWQERQCTVLCVYVKMRNEVCPVQLTD
jgi:hypothetical protein